MYLTTTEQCKRGRQAAPPSTGNVNIIIIIYFYIPTSHSITCICDCISWGRWWRSRKESLRATRGDNNNKMRFLKKKNPKILLLHFTRELYTHFVGGVCATVIIGS